MFNLRSSKPLRLAVLGVTALLSLHSTHAHADARWQLRPLLVLGGVAYDDTVGGRGASYIQNANGIFNVHTDGAGGHGGHSHGGDFRRGLNLQTLEAGLHAVAPGWGEAGLRLSSDAHRVELEEAWLRTAWLPGGLQAQGGRFFSAIGLQNDLHPHAWDFVDQAMPYQLLLAGGLRGDGLQLNWRLPAPLGLRFGVEALKSDNLGVAGQVGAVQGYTSTTGKSVNLPLPGAASWPQVWTAFTRFDWEGASGQHVFGGVSFIRGRQHQELHSYHPGINDADHALQGNTRTTVLSIGWRQRGKGDDGAGSFTLTGEYFKQDKDLDLVYHDTKPWNIGMPRALRIDGYVLQALYGVAPRWQIGLRWDAVGNVHEAVRSASPLFCAAPYQTQRCPRQNSQFDALQRLSAVATWTIDPHQRLRIQVSHAHVPVAEDINGDGRLDALRRTFNQVMLQYQITFGGHGAHRD
jgi:hypothetical protein